MRTRVRLGLLALVVGAVATACAVRGQLTVTKPLPTPAEPPSATVAETPPPALPTAVLQSVPLPGRAVWSADGTTLAVVGDETCSTTMVDVDAGLVLARLPGCLVIGASRKTFVMFGSGKQIDFWSPDGSGVQHVILPEPWGGTPLLSPDGGRLATLVENAIVLRDPDSGQEVRRVLVGDTRLQWIGSNIELGPWSADGEYLVVRGLGDKAWIVGVGKDDTQTPLDCTPVRARFAPRGDELGVDCADGGRVWSATEHRVVRTVPHFWQWSATGRYTLTPTPQLEVRDAVTDALVLRVASHLGTPVFSPDDAWLAVTTTTARGAWQLDVWDIASGKKVVTRDRLLEPQWSPDGAYLQVQEQAPNWRFVVLETAGWTERWSRKMAGVIPWAPAGARLAVGTPGVGVAIVDLHTLASRPMGAVESVSFSSVDVATDGGIVARFAPRNARWGEAPTCDALRMDAQGRTSATTEKTCDRSDVASPDGAWTTRQRSESRGPALMAPRTIVDVEDLATHARFFVDSGYRMWDAATWSARGHRLLVGGPRGLVYEADTHRVWSMRASGMAQAIDADGKRVAVSMQDSTVQVVTVDAPEPPIALPAVTETPLFFALAGDRLAAVGATGAVTVWDVARREIAASWEAGFAPLRLAWGGDGAFLAIAGTGQVRVSRPDGSGTVTLTGMRTQHGTTWLAQDEEGHVDGPPEAIAAVRWLAPQGANAALDAAQVERATGKSPVRPGMIEALLGGAGR